MKELELEQKFKVGDTAQYYESTHFYGGTGELKKMPIGEPGIILEAEPLTIWRYKVQFPDGEEDYFNQDQLLPS